MDLVHQHSNQKLLQRLVHQQISKRIHDRQDWSRPKKFVVHTVDVVYDWQVCTRWNEVPTVIG